jgi:hypothetical protein
VDEDVEAGVDAGQLRAVAHAEEGRARQRLANAAQGGPSPTITS